METIEIKDEKSAKAVFCENFGNDYQIQKLLGENYSRYKEFSKKDGNSKKWAEELCRNILEGIEPGNIADYWKKFDRVGCLTEYYFPAYLIAEPLVKAWYKVLENEKHPLYVGCILKYLERFIADSKNDIALILPLIDKTEEYLKQNAPEALLQSRYVSKEGHFRELASDIRRIANEYSVPEKNSYSFVKTDTEILNIIKDSLMEEWKDTDTVKEQLSELNCAYGVKDDEIFLTGASYASGSTNLHSWDIIEFAVVFLKEKTACLFRCKLENNGEFSFESYFNKYQLLKMYSAEISKLINYYRNQKAREQFLAEQGVHDWRDMSKWNNYEYACRKKFLSQYPKVLRNVYAKIPECYIKEVIIHLVDQCEELIGSYGIKETDFASPLTENEIAEWEKDKGIRIPDEYREFLKFSGRVNLPCYINFYGLNQIGSCREYLDKEEFYGFNDIGSFGGGGATLCISADDEYFYVWQDGEMNRLGNFSDTINYICCE